MRSFHRWAPSAALVGLAFSGLTGCRHTVRGVCLPPANGAQKAVQMEPTWDALDPNGVPLSPRWNAQSAPPGGGPLCLPDPERKDVCSGFPKAGGVPNGSPPCNQSARAEAPAKDVVHGVVCNTGRGFKRFSGHLNFVPATYVGFLYYQGHSFPDDDLDFELLPAVSQAEGWVLRRTGLTTNRPLDRGLEKRPELLASLQRKGLDHALHVEAKASETLARFTRPGWLRLLGGKDSERKDHVAGLPAVATGLLGLDAEHGAFSELHPAHALAIQTACSAAEETWQVFVRTAGNEGWCSEWNLPHFLDPPEGVFAIPLPTSGLVQKAEIASSDLQASVPGVIGPALRLEDRSMVLRFRWPDGASQDRTAIIHGEVTIVRAGGTCLDLARTIEASAADPSGGRTVLPKQDPSAEKLLRELLGTGAAGQPESLPHGGGPEHDLVRPQPGDSLAPQAPPRLADAPCPGGAAACDDALRPRAVDRTPTRAGLEVASAEDERFCGALASSRPEAASDRKRAKQVAAACQEWLRAHR